MEEATLEASPPRPAIVGDVETATRFLSALFDERDLILFRPIETWVEAGRKRSRVDYRNTCYRSGVPRALQGTLRQLMQVATEERLNLFFGTCPRLGDKGRFDLAWQVRTVRALWTDVDNVTVDEARKRIAAAHLPEPSIIVNSGNGVHLYWLLEVPYIIDDAGDPPPVETEWALAPDGRKKPRKYVVEDGEHVYLDQRRHVSRLSAKAEHIQDVLAGIAKAVGGDHTTDLARLLRLPGTLNRKDQRNGRVPAPTALVECVPERRYSLAVFESLKSASPETARARQIAAMPLPRPRRFTLAKADKLSELVAASSIAQAGTRSEADFAVCCYAIRSGLGKEQVWGQVEQVGKFSEQGRRYFDRTWDKAEFDVRAGLFDKLLKRTAPRSVPALVPSGSAHGDDGGELPPADEVAESGGRPTVVVDSRTTPVAYTLRQVTDHLLAAKNCFTRTEQLVTINEQQLTPVLIAPELAGLLNQHVEFFFVDQRKGEYRPLPAAYANTWLNQRAERARLPTIKLFTRNPVYADDWRLVGPGFDANSGIYYAGPAVDPRQSTKCVDALLRDFCFRNPGDRTNYLGVLLTAVLTPHFIGSKPAVLFNGNQPELSKSILAQIISILRDGQSAETASYNPNDEEFEKRLGAIVRRGGTTIIIDNAKSRGRGARIESACLERSITDPVLSFRLLGQSTSIRAENSHIFCVTANTPDVSRDLVTRCVVINLYHEGDPERRKFSIADPEGYALQHRLELLEELIGMVERWKAQGMPLAQVHSRFNKRGWGNVVGGILEACGEPDFLANAEEAAAQLDEVRREFVELVGVLADHPQGVWTASELVGLCTKHGLLSGELGEGSPRSLATKMGAIAARYLAEPFTFADGRVVEFQRTSDRKGHVYRVGMLGKVPNLGAFAEPLPNLENEPGSAR